MYCTYITQHLATGKFYFGKSSVAKVNAGYKGSGKKITDAFKKYPPEQWVTSILWEFETEDEAYSDEAQLVTEETIADALCMNIALGGKGGCRYDATPETRAKLSVSGKAFNTANPGHRSKVAKKMLEDPDYVKALSIAQRKRYDNKVGRTNARVCSVDGILWFDGVRQLQDILGSGKNGSRSPNFRYAVVKTAK